LSQEQGVCFRIAEFFGQGVAEETRFGHATPARFRDAFLEKSGGSAESINLLIGCA
jgi:hypothetical protein